MSDQRCGPPLGQLFGPPQAAESSKDTATQFDTLQALQRAAARWVHDRPSRHAPVHLAVRVALEIEYTLHHTTSSSTYDPQSNTLHTQQGDSHAAATERKHADRDSTGLFAQLLSPLSPSQFLRSSWEQRPVLIRSNNNDNASVSQLPSITRMLQRGMHLPAADASVHDVLSVFFHWVGEHTNDTDSGTSSDSDTDSDSGTSSDGDDDSDTDNDSDTSSDIGTSSDTAGSACGQGTTDRVVTRLKGEGHGKARVSPRQHAGLVYGSDVRLVRTVISGSRESFSFDIQGKTEGVTAKLTQGGAERGSQAVTVCVRRTEHWAKEGERVTLQDCKEAFEVRSLAHTHTHTQRTTGPGCALLASLSCPVEGPHNCFLCVCACVYVCVLVRVCRRLGTRWRSALSAVVTPAISAYSPPYNTPSGCLGEPTSTCHHQV